MSQVAVTEVAVVPVFKGFRRLVTNETDGAAKTSSQGFSRAFAKTGTDSGKTVGAGFKKAFEQSAQGTSTKVTKALEADVAKTSRALSAARLREQDAIGKVRLAQAQLNEANGKYSKDSSQVIRAQERLATASRQLGSAHEGTEKATDDLKRSQSELARAADRAGDELADAGQRGVTGFRSNIVGGVRSFAGPLIGAFAALGIGNIVADAFNDAKNFIFDAVTMASDLEQSVGGVDAVFGDSAQTIHAWAEVADQAVGLSKSSYNEFATVVGAQLKNLGVPLEEVTGTTNSLIELGADLAAQYGGPTSEAVSALSSLLRGERDPIERYGVSMNEASVKAEALSLGLAGVVVDQDKVTAAHMRAVVAQRKYDEAVEKNGANSTEALSLYGSLTSANASLESALEGTTVELTGQQKAQATLSLLMKQTADAQGAFGRESDTLAGKQQRNTAAWENLTTELGMAFLPVASQVADLIGKDIIPAIEELAGEQGPALADAFADIIPDLAELAKDLLPLLPGLVQAFIDGLPFAIQMISFLSGTLGPLIENIGGVLGAGQAMSDFFTGDLGPIEYLQKLQGLGGGIGELLAWAVRLAFEFPARFEAAKVGVQLKIDEIIGFVGTIPARAQAALGALGNVLFSSGQALMGGFLDGIDSMFDAIGDKVSDALDWVMGFFPHSPALRGPLSGSGWTQLQQSGGAFWEQWIGGMGSEGPEFPTFTGGGAAPFGAPGAPAPSGGAAGARTIQQTNHYAKEDPQVAAQLARDQLDHLLRSY